jgi:hypothetical protein
MESDTEREYLDDKLVRRFFGAVVRQAITDYRTKGTARSAEAAQWLDGIAENPNWRDALAERGRPRK